MTATLTQAALYATELAGYFVLWTFINYWTHRAAHTFGVLRRLHGAHHAQVSEDELSFNWGNLVGWFGDWPSTLDQWLTEVLPLALLIAVFPAAWPLAIYYYVDGFLLADGFTDHNPRLSIPFLAPGRYHLEHHRDEGVNFDGYTRLWDWVFGTYRHVD